MIAKLGIVKAKERYTKWWVGKYCRVSWHGDVQFRLVKDVILQGPPSFVYGAVFLVFDDGDEMLIPERDQRSYIPTKKDIEALSPDDYQRVIEAQTKGQTT